MKKLFQFLDNYLLKIGVGFALAFIVLYPKLPSIAIAHTWVYIRLEDFLISLIVLIWFIQLLRKKVVLPLALGIGVALYWVIGLVSLIFCLIFIGPHLANFFPKIAVLEYLRRIEYMILFFVGFSSVKNKKDILHYIIILFTTITGIILYGLGQRFYVSLWHIFPKFFAQNPFCFPAFLTSNEEFAKGVPLCLTATSRVAATFGGHYDLAAYLVFIIPVVISIFIVTKRWYWKVLTALIGLGSIEILNFTSSRTSFAAYLVGVVSMLILWKRKKWIIPVLFISIFITLLSNNSVLQRFAKTVQPVQVVTINTSSTNLPSNLQNIIKNTKEQEENQTPQSPPPGTVTIGSTGTGKPVASAASTLTTVVTDNELKKLQESDIAISTVSGTFLIQKAYALDISFTTRFQAEWPRDWAAFLSSPVFGTGYSSLTLASDNDYLRAVGETGIVGLVAFLFVFLILGIYMKNTVSSVKDPLSNAFLFGLAGGVVGLLMNAVLIDVFEASKVAESLWLLLGIGAGSAALFSKKQIDYKKELCAFFISKTMIGVYLFILMLLLFLGSMHNFFVGDDFTWLHWAASSRVSDIKDYFIHSSGFFYRPIAKTLVYFLYSFFSFQPEGYHLFTLFLHFLIAFGVYLFAHKLLKNKFFAFISAGIFLMLPSSAENTFWISTISTNLSTLCIIYALITYWHFKSSKKISFYFLTFVLGILSLLSYEGAIIFPLLLLLLDLFLGSWKVTKKQIFLSIPFILLSILYVGVHYAIGAVGAGGDYSYSIPHLLPNFIGNFIGYISLFIFGQHALPFYTSLRTIMKTQVLGISILLLVIVVGLFVSFFKQKKQLCVLIKKPVSAIFLFLSLFIFIALLPFLGLGNLSERYSYRASCAFAIVISFLFMQIKENYQKSKQRIFVYGISFLCFIIITANYIVLLQRENQDWNYAGTITAHTLKFFRLNDESVAPNSVFAFVNVPIRYNNAWIFPVGLSDGLWFVYRDTTVHVIQVSSVDQAIAQNASYIFAFDKKDMIYQVK
jgi:hypothetical protein